MPRSLFRYFFRGKERHSEPRTKRDHIKELLKFYTRSLEWSPSTFVFWLYRCLSFVDLSSLPVSDTLKNNKQWSESRFVATRKAHEGRAHPHPLLAHFDWLFVHSSMPHLAHDVPHVGVVHRVAGYRSRVAVKDVHQVALLAVLKHQVQLVHLSTHPAQSVRDFTRELCKVDVSLLSSRTNASQSLHTYNIADASERNQA